MIWSYAVNELDKNILKASLEYLFWFSRFEYTLKKERHLRSHKIGSKAEPDWFEFRDKYFNKYSLTVHSKKLIALKPHQEIIENSDLDLCWEEVPQCQDKNPLCTIINLLKAVRNNLFHGGKHTSENEESKKRNLELIEVSILVIQEIAKINHFGEETFKPYEDFNFKKEIFLQE